MEMGYGINELGQVCESTGLVLGVGTRRKSTTEANVLTFLELFAILRCRIIKRTNPFFQVLYTGFVEL